MTSSFNALGQANALRVQMQLRYPCSHSACCVMQHNFGINWDNWGGGGGRQAGRRVAPTLQAMPLRCGGIPTLVLASGAFEGVVISEHGHLIDRFGFPVSLLLTSTQEQYYSERHSFLIALLIDVSRILSSNRQLESMGNRCKRPFEWIGQIHASNTRISNWRLIVRA